MMHGHGKMGATPVFNAARRSDANARSSVPHLSFFFFLMDSHQLGSNSHRTRPIRLESGRIGRIGAYRLAAETDRNRPKLSLNHIRTAEIGFE